MRLTPLEFQIAIPATTALITFFGIMQSRRGTTATIAMTRVQTDISALSARNDSLQAELDRAERRLDAIQDDLDNCRQQVSNLQAKGTG